MTQSRFLALLVVALLTPLSAPAQQADSKAPHVVFLVGDAEYRSEVTMPALAERLRETFGFRTTLIQDAEIISSDDNRMPGIEALREADLLVIFTRFRRWPQRDLDELTAYLKRGGPVVGFRTSTHAFNYDEDDPRHRWNAFGAQVLGAPWIYHYGHESSTDARVVNRERAPDLLAGVPDRFAVRSWTYHVRPNHPPVGARILVEGRPVFPDERQAEPGMVNPVAWTMTHSGGGRVFTTTMGHPEDFRTEAFRRLVGNGIQWALGRGLRDRTLPDFPAVTHPDDAEGGEDEEGERPWLAMDYGPFLSSVVGLPGEGAPRPETVVYKGIVQRLRFPDGRESELSAVFDTDLLRWRCVWRGDLALRGIVFDGPHGTFPEIEGEPLFVAKPLPGPTDLPRATKPRTEPYGPIDPRQGRWAGLALAGGGLRFEYEVAGSLMRERIFALGEGFVREIENRGESRSLRLVDSDLEDDARFVVSGGTLKDRGRTLVLPARGRARVALVPGSDLTPKELRELDLPALDAPPEPRWGPALTRTGVVDVRPEGPDAGVSVRELPAGRAVSLEIVADEDGRQRGTAGPELRPYESEKRSSADKLVTSEGYVLRPLGQASRVPDADLLGRWSADRGEGERERNAVTGRDDLELDGVTWRRGIRGRSLDFDGTAAAWLRGTNIDLAEDELSVSGWIQTTGDGTVFALARERGRWSQNGLSLFIQDGRLALDVGWVGFIDSQTRVADGAWHHVGLSWRDRGEDVRLFVDGRRVARGSLPLLDEETRGFVPRFGWTSEDFPATSRFGGYMDELALTRTALDAAGIASLAGDALVEAVVLRDAPADAYFERGPQGGVLLRATPPEEALTVAIERRRGDRARVEAWAAERRRGDATFRRPFRVDRLTWPADNPHRSWMRFGAFDFLPAENGDPQSAAITTWSGDVWRVDGLDEGLEELRWTRMATGLHQPFGLIAEPEGILVLGRDQITRLEDRDGDGETDHYRVHSNAPRNSQHFHEPASGLIRDARGRLLFVKAARHAKLGLHDHHGAIIRLKENGHDYEVLARGLRAPVGLTPLPDGSLLTTDQEGHWMPANRINLVRPSVTSPPFFGNGWASGDTKRRIRREGERVFAPWRRTVERTTPPLCWLHPTFDRSPATLEFIDHEAWGPLRGSIFGLSYGTGELYLVLRDDVTQPDGRVVSQGGAVKLGVQLPTGILDAHVHPKTGDLYCCGLFGWSSDRTDPGGFFRIRPHPEAWQSLDVPVRIRAFTDGLEMRFLGEPPSLEASAWSAEAWNYRPTSRYGSPDISLEGEEDERTRLSIRRVRRIDERTVFVEIDEFRPAMQVEVSWGTERRAHLSVHTLRERR